MLKNLQTVEIELHSYCNRKCPWCPNSIIDRTFYEEMPEEIFLSILQDLKDNNYNKVIRLTRYFEPMSNMELLRKRIQQIKKYLPNCYIKINTNGDYVNKENLDGLNINKLNINDYDAKGQRFILQKFEECGIKIDNMASTESKIRGVHPNIEMVEYRVDWLYTTKLCDRGGSLDFINAKEREDNCFKAFNSTCIDYNGDVLPCCNMRHDVPEHIEFIMGNIKQSKLSEIWNSEKLAEFNNIIMSMDYKNYPNPCKHCTSKSKKSKLNLKS